MAVSENKKCFVIMSFRPEYDEAYTLICNVASQFGYETTRMDDSHKVGSITEEIVRFIIEADLVIADLTGGSSNVYYEVGISHCVGNKTLLISQDVDNLPFDTAGQYTLKYDLATTESKKLFRFELRDLIEQFEIHRKSDPSKPLNIVQSAGREYFDIQQRIRGTLDELLVEREHLAFLKQYIDDEQVTDNSNIVEEVSERIIRIFNQTRERMFVAFSGAAGVGKSTFTGQIKAYIEKKRQIKVSILQLDAFMLDRAERMIRAKSGYDVASSDLDLAAECILQLKAGIPQEIHPYNHDTGKHGEAIKVEPAEIVLVEGIHSLNPKLLQNFSLKVFLYSSPETTSELRFLADVFKRSYSPREAFAHANTEYAAFEKHILHYINFADIIIIVNEYWNYELVKDKPKG